MKRSFVALSVVLEAVRGFAELSLLFHSRKV